MELLSNYLDEEELEQIIETFDEQILTSLDVDNMREIMNFLEGNKIEFIKDIVVRYLDLFLIPSDEFKGKFLALKEKYAKWNFNELIAYKMDIFEEMYK